MIEQQSTRELLLTVALRLFTTKGYHGTSMRDIASDAGIRVSGIYNHYSNKEAIFEAVMRRWHPFIGIQPVLLEIEGLTIRECLADTIRRLMNSYDEKPEGYKLLFIEIIEFNGQHLPTLAAELQPKIHDWMKHLLQAEGHIRVSSAETLFHWLMTILFAYFSAKYLMKVDLDIEQFIGIYIDGIVG